MRILLDAFGGDNSPIEIVKGAISYVNQGGTAEITLVGQEDIVKNLLIENGYKGEQIKTLNSTEVITCEETPTEAIRKKPDSSICVALQGLRSKEYDAFVTAGSTGAVLTGAVLKVGRIKGVSRPCLAVMLPTVNPDKQVLLLDCGANADCKPQNLVHFAVMGDAFMKNVYGVKEPKIGLLSNGVEDKKGNELVHSVHPILRELKSINFSGNLEARDILTGEYDVVVTDGFSGNVALKSTEGAVSLLLKIIKKNVMASASAKFGYIFMKGAFNKVKETADYNSKGGAVLLGCSGLIVKCHGSSTAESISAGLFQAELATKNNVNQEIESRLNDEEIKNLVFS